MSKKQENSPYCNVFVAFSLLLTYLLCIIEIYKNSNHLICLCFCTDILYIASLDTDGSSITESTKLTLKCFLESFCGVSSDPISLCDLPASNKPIDGPGILINLLGKRRCQSFAAWIIKLLSKCLTEGTLYLEGLINLSFVSAACSLLCYGDADLQMVGNRVTQSCKF